MTGGTEMKSLQLEIQRNQTALRNFQEKIAEKERKNVELTRRIQMEIEEKDSVMETYELIISYEKFIKQFYYYQEIIIKDLFN